MKNKDSNNILILFLIVISSCNVIAQDQKDSPKWQPLYDSLKKHYHLKDKSKVDYYAQELFTSKKINIHDSLKVYIGAITASLNDTEEEAFKYLNLTEEPLLQSGKDKNLIAWIYYYKADWYYNNFYDKKALNFFLKADSVFTAINRKSFMSVMTKSGISDVLINSELNKNPLIIDQIFIYVEEGLRVSDSLGHNVPSAILLYKKGELFLLKGDLEKADYFYKKSLEISVKINNNIRQSLIYTRLAKIALKKSLLDSAIIYQEKAVLKSKGINDLKVISNVNLELGKGYNKIKNYDGAIKHLNYAKEVLEKSESSKKEPYHDIENSLAEAYFGKGEFKKAYVYLESAKKSIQAAQQIKNKERVKRLMLNTNQKRRNKKLFF